MKNVFKMGIIAFAALLCLCGCCKCDCETACACKSDSNSSGTAVAENTTSLTTTTSTEASSETIAEEVTEDTSTSISKEEEQAVYDVLNKTKVNPNFRPTIGNMISAVFYEYEITCTPTGITEGSYSVKVSGDYCPNPDVPNLSSYGEIYYYVNTETGNCMITSDDYGINSVFLAFILS